MNADFNLTAFMKREGILRIARNPHGFSVYIEGDILGTGETVAEAYESAARQRDDRPRRKAA